MPAKCRRIGNQVKFLSGPATVYEEFFSADHCVETCEKVKRMKRCKPGDLLDVNG